MSLSQSGSNRVSDGVTIIGPRSRNRGGKNKGPGGRTSKQEMIRTVDLDAVDDAVRKRCRDLVNNCAAAVAAFEIDEVQGQDINIGDISHVGDDADVAAGEDNDNEDAWADDADVEAFRMALENNLTTGVRLDERTWRDRLCARDDNWQHVFPRLKAAYLQWKYGISGRQGERKRSAPGEDTPSDEEAPPGPHTVVCVDLYSLRKEITVEVSSGQWTVEALALLGYLGNTAIGPSIVISFATLELFRCLKLVKPSFSTEAFTKLVCYKYYRDQMVYRRHYRTALADAFDIYLEVLDDVDAKIQEKLGRGDPNWRPHFRCPPCGYKNTYYLGLEFVNRFTKQVPARQAQPKPTTDLGGDALDQAPEPAPVFLDTEGDPTDGEVGAPSPCATNWKAAAADKRGGFDETGIFASACSAKYGVAMVDKISTELPCNILLGYDIGCVFGGTLAWSSAGPEFWSTNGTHSQPTHHETRPDQNYRWSRTGPSIPDWDDEQ
ncbi:uncharacterized protein BXZ73DRAFT_79166 [Epithele typhae]|uniref:uncharacterized protein n=1 Tax=Epithele typhae TaxID=378194 RepID=UPI0020075EB7|nr:uncharacterized protein BXZ73DRAFT_79166 [Epithele typhae]KAH9924600.1 hypothetical protein BXZ73DRAFT_79166 [Epithele typhae]